MILHRVTMSVDVVVLPTDIFKYDMTYFMSIIHILKFIKLHSRIIFHGFLSNKNSEWAVMILLRI